MPSDAEGVVRFASSFVPSSSPSVGGLLLAPGGKKSSNPRGSFVGVVPFSSSPDNGKSSSSSFCLSFSPSDSVFSLLPAENNLTRFKLESSGSAYAPVSNSGDDEEAKETLPLRDCSGAILSAEQLLVVRCAAEVVVVDDVKKFLLLPLLILVASYL